MYLISISTVTMGDNVVTFCDYHIDNIYFVGCYGGCTATVLVAMMTTEVSFVNKIENLDVNVTASIICFVHIMAVLEQKKKKILEVV